MVWLAVGLSSVAAGFLQTVTGFGAATDGGSALFFRYGGVSGAVFVHLHGAGGFFGAAISSCYPAAVGSVSGTDLYGGKCFVNSFVS